MLSSYCSDQLSPHHPSDPDKRLLLSMYCGGGQPLAMLSIMTPADQLMSVSDNTRNNWRSTTTDDNLPLVFDDCNGNQTPVKETIVQVRDIVHPLHYVLWHNVSSSLYILEWIVHHCQLSWCLHVKQSNPSKIAKVISYHCFTVYDIHDAQMQHVRRTPRN